MWKEALLQIQYAVGRVFNLIWSFDWKKGRRYISPHMMPGRFAHEGRDKRSADGNSEQNEFHSVPLSGPSCAILQISPLTLS